MNTTHVSSYSKVTPILGVVYGPVHAWWAKFRTYGTLLCTCMYRSAELTPLCYCVHVCTDMLSSPHYATVYMYVQIC